MALVRLTALPRHIAIVMDGNGRWANLQHRPRTEGHRAGSKTVRTTVTACRKLGINALTLFAFSAQNWARPSSEIEALMALLEEFLSSEREEMIQRQIRFRAIGRLDLLPRFVRALVDDVAQATAAGTGLTLTLALSYGGREEIVDAAKALAEQVANGSINTHDITEQALTSRLPSMDVGPVDLMIRTGGEQRISNFLLWGSAYAELYFSDKMWPDFRDADLFEAIAEYQRRERRFGKVISDESFVAEHDSREKDKTRERAVDASASAKRIEQPTMLRAV